MTATTRAISKNAAEIYGIREGVDTAGGIASRIFYGMFENDPDLATEIAQETGSIGTWSASGFTFSLYDGTRFAVTVVKIADAGLRNEGGS